MTGIWRRKVADFVFTPTSDDWVAILRIGLGSLAIGYCLAWRDDWTYLFGGTGRGLLSRELSELLLSAESPWIPRLGWITDAAERAGWTEQTALSSVWVLLLLAAFTLTLGLFCRTSAMTVWFLHLCAAKSSGVLAYGLDNFMTIGLFYLMCAPLPDRLSLDYKRKRNTTLDPKLLSVLRRTLQVHLCIVYFFGGITKMLGTGWWDGLNLWRALTREPLNVISAETLSQFASILPFAGIAVWLIEIAYPVMIWHRRTRPVWLVLTCGMHLAIGLAMGMHLFGFVMIVLNAAAFGSSFHGAKVSEHRGEQSSGAANVVGSRLYHFLRFPT